MSEPTLRPIPADQPARNRIEEALDVNLLVEAGAGSGKTTALVARMLRLVLRGTPVERIAAVTFTRKAANELRERFQQRLEKELRNPAADEHQRGLVRNALHDLDRAFLGTIHSFCARLLRERPLEIGLDPNFDEVSDADWAEMRKTFWREWVNARRREDSPLVRDLHDVGLDPRSLQHVFEKVVDYRDVEFPLGRTPKPDIAPARAALEAALGNAHGMLPNAEPEKGWDALMTLVRRLHAHRRVHGWDDHASLCQALALVTENACKPTLNRWGVSREDVKAIEAAFRDVCTGIGAETLRQWYEHRYPPVMRCVLAASSDFAATRLATARLSFEDLLTLAARLLRENAGARTELGERYAHLLVDEFQDTDPIQAEVCLLLASPPSEGNDWRTVTPRPGSLFVVGDPKQSIYRFRRADIQVYDLVKRRFGAFGEVLALTQNFRSTKPIETVVNAKFRDAFPAESTPEQAPFREMVTGGDPSGAVSRYLVQLPGSRKVKAETVFAEDASIVASIIARRIADGTASAQDFLVLTTQKDEIAIYARALAERNVPVTTTGAKLPRDRELDELLVVLHAIADPDNPVLVAAALEGLFFGLSPARLFTARKQDVHFSITHPPAEVEHPACDALRQLHEWWKLSQREAADVLVERILDDTGLLFAAAGEDLGDARAGALLHVVEAIRAGSTTGGAGIVDAMERIATLLDEEAPDARLRPGRSDAVRIMNLHKAKGLEAEVVFLAAPREHKAHEPTMHVRRTEDGAATGWMVAQEKNGYQSQILAQAPGWAEHADAEARFADAEAARLLYVAATRAKRELIVAEYRKLLKDGPKPVPTKWSALDPALSQHSALLDVSIVAPTGRDAVREPAEAIALRVEEARARVAAAQVWTYRVTTVTESAKGDATGTRAHGGAAGGRGVAWGRAVHRAIEGMARGRDGANLARFVAAVARDERLTDTELGELQRLLAELRASEVWAAFGGSVKPMLEVGVMRAVQAEGRTEVVEGVVDALLTTEDGWRVVDWKTDEVSDATWAERATRYRAQVESYAQILGSLTGRTAVAAIERVRVKGSQLA